jgi:hypothetical protein
LVRLERRLALKEDEEAAGVSNFEVVIGSNSQVAAAVAAAADRTLDDSNKKFRNYQFRHAKILSSK